ncbi:MAG TPA: aldo/keto reductase [Solirubrobacterales bacterium]|nr:aldo/keto reductase [Solirubrobacterales bacterium]
MSAPHEGKQEAQPAAPRRRALGAEGLQVPALGLGCMGMSALYGLADQREATATIHRALELGVTLLDTADAYGPFRNEQLIGAAIAGRQGQVTVATKLGYEIDRSGAFTGRINGTPGYVRACVEGSLRRLGVEALDLCYLHRVDPDTPVEETFGALGELVTRGMVRYLGISEAAPATIRRAHATHPLTAVQTEYSLLARQVEDNGVLATARELGIGFVAYAPLCRGLLSNRFSSVDELAEDDFRRTDPRLGGENLAHNRALVQCLGEIAARRAVTTSQLSLAWLLHRGAVAIPGATQRRHLEENVSAAGISLSPADLAAIDAALPASAVAGERYAPEYLDETFR